jgi:hypothetical protein
MNLDNQWDADDFEDTVAAALIACFETKFRRHRGAAPADRLTEERIAVLRNAGPYIPGPSRYVIAHDAEKEEGYFDIHNDPLPLQGCIAMKPSIAHTPDAYLVATYVRRTKALGRNWFKQAPGMIYEMLVIDVLNSGIDGERRFFTVSKNGVVTACVQRIQNNRGYQPGRPTEVLEPDKDWKVHTSAGASFALQFLADRRFCWSITAQEQIAKAHLGCMKEEIKSLLYARSLPMTTTGRKRPILHLVESHRRRMQSGTDVDVTAFLRGTQTVEIGGTLFSVRPPDVLKPELSAPSVRRYYENQSAA